MYNTKSFQIPIGYQKRIEEVILHPGFRTVEQFEVVRKLTENENFDFACMPGIFTPESANSTYQGPFCLLWNDKNDLLHLTRIGKRGKILKEITANNTVSV
jgi:hypothetical protein